ncbi:MAG: hypothetical protein JJV99_11980 [Colwellia sp.]|nr:hypothetical protein [Colwellia sp.]
MIRLFFLLPIIMCVIWWLYLNSHNYSLKEGLKGFIYILSFNAVIVLFFVMMIYVTHQ